MNPFRSSAFPTPRAMLVGGNLLAVVLLAWVGFALLSSSRDNYRQRARDASENLAAIMSGRIAAEVDQIDNALRSATFGLRRLEAAGKASPRAIDQVLIEQQLVVDDIDVVRVADAAGIVRFGARTNVVPPVDLSDRDWFRQVRDSTRNGLVVSEPIQAKIDKKWVVVFARRLETGDGQFAGAIYANVDVTAFNRMLEGVALGDEGAITLRSGSLGLIARRTSKDAGAAAIGTAKVSAELSRAVRERPGAGSFVSQTALDGVERTTAYKRTEQYPLLVLVGLGTREFYAPWRTQALETVTILVALAVVLAVASTLVYRAWLRQQAAQERMAALATEQEAMLDNEIVGMTKARGRRTIWKNKALDRMFGYDGDELLDTPTRLLYVDDESHRALGEAAYKTLAKGGTYRAQLPMRRKDGSAVWVDISGTRISAEESLWLMVDITTLKQHEARVEHIAFHDALTGLPNRLLLSDRLGQAIKSAQRSQRQVVVAYFDLDGFKSVNDTHGHDAGDVLLREVAARLTAEVRGNDTVARLGGDEFVIVMTETEAHTGAPDVLRRVLDRLQEPVEIAPGRFANVGASVGAAVYPDDCEDEKGLLARADRAMFAAKRTGKNRIKFHGRVEDSEAGSSVRDITLKAARI